TINEEINTILLNLCETKKKPYNLTITVGSYTTNDGRESVDSIIKKADEVLYKRKKKYKKHEQPQT
ncbi:MAG: diguanylate cyclase domain-containing protein, partial [Acetivibrio ethanolgignens]